MGLRVGCVGFSTEQGISYLMKDFHDHGIVTDVAVLRHGRRPDHPEWYERPLVIGNVRGQLEELKEFCRPLDCLLTVETPFRYELYDFCRSIGVRTVLMPMYEGFPQHPPSFPDCFACPSLLDQVIFRGMCAWCHGSDKMPGWGNVISCLHHPFVPVPVERPWRQRTKALRFLHNGGHLGLRGHKGTLELLRAMELVKAPIDLTVRAQDERGMHAILGQVPSAQKDKRITLQIGAVPRESLFDDHDVLVQPEKYNGLSLPLQEARASGMLVVTTDRFPHNTWLPRTMRTGFSTMTFKEERHNPLVPIPGTVEMRDEQVDCLIPVRSYSKQRVAGSCLEYDEALVEPQLIAETLDRLHGADISEYSLSGKAWAETMSWSVLKPVWEGVLKG